MSNQTNNGSIIGKHKYKLVERLPNGNINIANTFSDVLDIINMDTQNMFWQKLERNHMDNIKNYIWDIGVFAWLSANRNVYLVNDNGDELKLFEMGLIEINGTDPKWIDPTFSKLMDKFLI